jgi:hypothetical protein
VSIDNLEFLVIYCGVGFVFALLVFAVSVVSIPLDARPQPGCRHLDDRQHSRPGRKSALPLLIWAALIVTLTLLGFLSFHLGLVPC